MSEALEARLNQLEAANKALTEEMSKLKEQVLVLEKELKERPELKGRPDAGEAAGRTRARSGSTAASLGQTVSAAGSTRQRRQSQGGGGATKALSFLELLGITQQTPAAPAPGAPVPAAAGGKRQPSSQAPQQAKMPLASDALPVLQSAVKAIEKHFVRASNRTPPRLTPHSANGHARARPPHRILCSGASKRSGSVQVDRDPGKRPEEQGDRRAGPWPAVHRPFARAAARLQVLRMPLRGSNPTSLP